MLFPQELAALRYCLWRGTFADKSLYGIQPPRGQRTGQELSWLEALVKFCRLIRLTQYERAV